MVAIAGDRGALDAGFDVHGVHASTHDSGAVAAEALHHRYWWSPPTPVSDDEGDLALVTALDEATADCDVAGFLGWVGVHYRVGAGLVDGDDDIVRVGLGPRQGEPFPQAPADDQDGGGFGVDNQVQRGRLV